MAPLELLSETYSPQGNMAAEGLTRVLGSPSLDRVTVLIREAVQNSHDAGVKTGNRVTFSVDCWEASEEQRQALKGQVFAKQPHRLRDGGPDLAEVLSRPGLRLLCISDRGTTGLGGPTRADRIEDDASPDFVNFLYNFGQPRDTAYGGGTYGYGKVALYLSSAVRTLCIHTHTSYRGRTESRFIAASLGDQFVQDQTRFTGRHWWGRSQDGVCEPVLGAEADELARSIGMPEFAPGALGTSLLIVAPSFPEQEAGSASVTIVNALLKWFWPKMVREGASGMDFTIDWDGTRVPIADPKTVPALQPFVRGLEAIHALERGEPVDDLTVKEAWCLNPHRQVGTLALTRFPVRDTQRGFAIDGAATDTDSSPESGQVPPFPGRVGSVALMRRAELVVAYHQGPTHIPDSLDYAGVFLTPQDPQIDDAFARSEPPTHDAWNPEFLDGRNERRLVNTAKRRIREEVDAYARVEARLPEAHGSGGSLAALAEALSGLLPAVEGDAPGGTGDGRGSGGAGGAGGSTSVRANVSVTGNPILKEIDGMAVLVTRVHVSVPANSTATRLEARASVLVDDAGVGTEGEAPEGADSPEVLYWQRPDGSQHPGPGAPVVAGEDCEWEVVVRVPEDAAIRVGFGVV